METVVLSTDEGRDRGRKRCKISPGRVMKAKIYSRV